MFNFLIKPSDRVTDQLRFAPVQEAIVAALAEIERETNALRLRCEKARCSAAFAMEALESDPGNAALEQRVQQLSDTLVKGEQRLAQLEAQRTLLLNMEREISVHTAEEELAV